MRYDYVYFYLDEHNNKIPIATGVSHDLNTIFWLSKNKRKAIVPNKLLSQTLFVLVLGSTFIVNDQF